MKLSRRNAVLLTIALATFLLPALAQAQIQAQPSSDTGDISVTIENQAITLTNETALYFGTILPFGRPGTATVAPSGSESSSDVFISSPGHAAAWSVTGVPNAPYAITLPSSPVVITSGSNSMNVDTFTRTGGSGPVFLNNSGNGSFNVGATLHVGANQPAGSYIGTYTVTVAYN
jgi:hypothetical protein